MHLLRISPITGVTFIPVFPNCRFIPARNLQQRRSVSQYRMFDMNDKMQAVADLQALIEEKIDALGWTVVSVQPGTMPDTPPFSYSVGFSDLFGTEEILIVGEEPARAWEMAARLACRLKTGLRIGPDAGPLAGISSEGRVAFRQVPDWTIPDIAVFAWRLCRRKPGLVQMLLPDEDGRLPGEPGCAAGTCLRQDIRPLVQTAAQ